MLSEDVTTGDGWKVDIKVNVEKIQISTVVFTLTGPWRITCALITS